MIESGFVRTERGAIFAPSEVAALKTIFEEYSIESTEGGGLQCKERHCLLLRFHMLIYWLSRLDQDNLQKLPSRSGSAKQQKTFLQLFNNPLSLCALFCEVSVFDV